MTRVHRALVAAALLGAVTAAGAGTARASPWAEVGDRQLRADIELLAEAGLIDGVITTWPIPWAQVSRAFSPDAANGLPPYAKRALERVRARFERGTAMHRWSMQSTARTTNEPTLVRDFSAGARYELEAHVSAERMWSSTAVRLSVGSFTDYDFDDPKLSLDGSYLAQELGNVLLYAGYLDHWWGPGEISSLILSNNARPFPKIGFMRNNPKAFETPWLSWIGPWQIHGFVGLLEENSRQLENPFVAGLRVSVNPLPGVELAATRTFQICGDGRPCDADTWYRAIIGDDNVSPPDRARGVKDPSNQLAGIDARITNSLFGQPFAIYGQLIGEDEASGLPADWGGLFGGSLWGGVGDEGAMWRLTVEYSDTTASFWGKNPEFDNFYTNSSYPDGYRYRGRTLGASLDNDTRLFSAVASLTDTRDWTYTLSFHHANINRDGGGIGAKTHPVSRNHEKINMLHLDLTIPWRQHLFAVGLRLQDDDPNTPGSSDAEIAAEVGWRARF